MRILTLLFLFTLAFSFHISAQKYLIIERTGTPKTEKIAVFDEIKFQLKDDDKGWYTRQILDLNADAQLILLGDTWMPVSDISRLYLKRKRVLPMILSGALAGGGASMILGDLYYTLVKNQPELTQGGIEFGLVNIAVGTALRFLWGPIKYDLGKKTRLRVIDITYRSTSAN